MRRMFLMAVLLASCVLGQTPARPIQRQAGAPQQAPQPSQRGTKEAPLVVEGVVATERSEAEAQRQADEGKEKAKVDASVARYTRWSALFTLLLAMATAVQIGLFWWQLRIMKATLNGTSDAALAAKASAESAKASFEAYASSERAWVSHSRVLASPTSGRTEDGRPMEATMLVLHWKNAGRTPALNLRLIVDWQILDPNQDVPVFTSATGGLGDSMGVVGPGLEIAGKERLLAQADLARLREGRCRVILYGYAEYTDLFNPAIRRVTEVCFEARIRGTVEGAPRFVFSPVGDQNTAS